MPFAIKAFDTQKVPPVDPTKSTSTVTPSSCPYPETIAHQSVNAGRLGQVIDAIKIDDSALSAIMIISSSCMLHVREAL
jgi:hypothetical protein